MMLDGDVVELVARPVMPNKPCVESDLAKEFLSNFQLPPNAQPVGNEARSLVGR